MVMTLPFTPDIGTEDEMKRSKSDEVNIDIS